MIYWKVYRLEPPRRFGEGAKLRDESVTITMDPQRAIEMFKQQIATCETNGIANKASTDCVFLTMQRSPDPGQRGKIIYRSNMGGKIGRSRIGALDKRVILPATREYGKLVETTWRWHPRFINGIEACVEAGHITRDQGDQLLAGATAEEMAEARRAMAKLIAKAERRASRERQDSSA